MRLRHKRRRGGLALVGGGQYPIDPEGYCDMPEDKAAMALQAAGSWEAVASEQPKSAAVRPEPVKAPPIPEKTEVTAPPPREETAVAETEPEGETDGNGDQPEDDLRSKTKGELLALAEQLGLKVDGRISKLRLVSEIRSALEGEAS